MTVLQRRLAEPIFRQGGPVACLLLHGFSGSPAELRPLIDHLAGCGLTVRAPLLPGHGATPEALRQVRWPEWVSAAEAEYQALAEQHASVHVVGFSMGALITLYLAARREVATATALSCPIRLEDWKQVLLPLAKYLAPTAPAAAQREDYDQFPLATIHSLVHLADQVRRDLPNVKAPLLAVQGEHDPMIASDSGSYMLEHVCSRDSRQVILPHRHHLITLERGREEVSQLVYDWITGHEQEAK